MPLNKETLIRQQEDLEIGGNEDHSNFNIEKIGKNTKKSLGNLKDLLSLKPSANACVEKFTRNNDNLKYLNK